MFVDSHCHLNFPQLLADLPGILDAMAQARVDRALCIGTTIEEFPAVHGLAMAHAHLWATVGVHPDNEGVHEPTLAELIELAQRDKVVAIGETGLDYYYGRDSVARQQDWFRVHVAAARELGKPLIVHTRDAREDTLRILREEGAAEVGGVLHCFTEDWDMAERALELGFHISFSGIVTFKNAKPIQEVARRLPAERLLVETDSPYLAPAPHRGKPNHPAWVRHVAEFVARLRGESLEQVAAVTTANYRRLFGISPSAPFPPAGEGSEREAA